MCKSDLPSGRISTKSKTNLTETSPKGAEMKKIIKPDGYYLLDHDGDIRIFASWSGGYLDGDSWRISSAAELREETDETLTYLTLSNTFYVLRKGSEGQVSAHNHAALEQALEVGCKIIREEPCHSINIAVENAANNKPSM
jgi:hypothetical protein